MTFTCEARLTDELNTIPIVFFSVDDEVAAHKDLEDRGFKELRQKTINGTTRRTLLVEAYNNNNNTGIYCTLIPHGTRSDNATLMIQGKVDLCMHRYVILLAYLGVCACVCLYVCLSVSVYLSIYHIAL